MVSPEQAAEAIGEQPAGDYTLDFAGHLERYRDVAPLARLLHSTPLRLVREDYARAGARQLSLQPRRNTKFGTSQPLPDHASRCRAYCPGGRETAYRGARTDERRQESQRRPARTKLMAKLAIYMNEAGHSVVYRAGFSWMAAIVRPIWALQHRLYKTCVATLVINALLPQAYALMPMVLQIGLSLFISSVGSGLGANLHHRIVLERSGYFMTSAEPRRLKGG